MPDQTSTPTAADVQRILVLPTCQRVHKHVNDARKSLDRAVTVLANHVKAFDLKDVQRLNDLTAAVSDFADTTKGYAEPLVPVPAFGVEGERAKLAKRFMSAGRHLNASRFAWVANRCIPGIDYRGCVKGYVALALARQCEVGEDGYRVSFHVSHGHFRDAQIKGHSQIMVELILQRMTAQQDVHGNDAVAHAVGGQS